MKKSEIKVGEEYAVYVSSIFRPRKQEQEAPHYQPRGGVPGGVRDSEIVRGKVVAVDVERWQAGGFSTYYSKQHDGILVKLAKPLSRRADFGDSTVTITEIAVTSRHLLRTWATEAANRKARAQANILQRARYRQEIEEFAPRLAQIRAALDRAGLGPTRLQRDASGLSFEGGSIKLRRVDVEGNGKWQPTGVTWDGVRVDTSVFFDLVGVPVEADGDDAE